MRRRLYPVTSLPRIRDAAVMTADDNSSTCVSGTVNVPEAHRRSSRRSFAGTVLATPKIKTSRLKGSRFQRALLKLAVRLMASFLFSARSMISYSIDQSCMVSSYFPLLAKKRLGATLLYAHPAAPNIVVLPPPFGPISDVTGKSNE